MRERKRKVLLQIFTICVVISTAFIALGFSRIDRGNVSSGNCAAGHSTLSLKITTNYTSNATTINQGDYFDLEVTSENQNLVDGLGFAFWHSTGDGLNIPDTTPFSAPYGDNDSFINEWYDGADNYCQIGWTEGAGGPGFGDPETQKFRISTSTTGPAVETLVIQMGGDGDTRSLVISFQITIQSLSESNPPDVSISAPTDNSYVNGSSVSITATADDNGESGVDSVWTEITNATYNETVSMSGTEPTYTGTWDSTVVADGTYTLKVKANDSNSPTPNLNNTESITIKVDNTAPGIAIDSVLPNPSNGLTNIKVSNTTSDTDGNGVRATITSTGPTIYKDLVYWGGFWQNNFTIISTESYTVNVNATDFAGNYATAGPSVITGDVGDPSITINTPVLNAPIGANAPSYDVTVTESNPDELWYSLDGGTTNSSNVASTGTISQSMWDAQPNGTVTITFYANDTAGNENFAIRNVIKDIWAPSIAITTPTSNQLEGVNPPTYSLSITEGNLDQVWYSLDGGTTNSTPSGSTSGTINSGLWSAEGNGTVTIRFYANDTTGNESFSEVTIRKDIIAPSISVTTPTDNQLTGISPPTYSLSITEASLDQIWYSLDGGSTNSTPSGSTSGTIDSALWAARPNGTVTITFYANDTLGNEGTSTRDVRKDIIAPSISVTTPTDNQLTGDSPPTYSLSITEANLDQIWYSLDGGSTNSTPSGSPSGTIDSALWAARPNGTVTITFYANDTLGNEGTSTRDVRKDIIAPSISVTTPTDNQLIGASSPTYSLSITEANLDQIWYSLDGGSTNSTPSGSTSGTIDSALWAARPNGTVTITFYANDTLGNEGTSTRDVRKDIIAPSISVTTPIHNQLNGANPPTYSLSITEANLDQIWYSLDGGSTNSTSSGSTSGTIDSGLWAARLNGTVTITFYANDTLGNEGTSTRDVRKDIIAPSISVTTPNHNQLNGASPPTYSLSITEANLDQIWYSLDGGSTNSTSSGSTSGTIDSGLWAARPNGTVTITFYANDTLGNEGITNIDVRKDIILPDISITNPSFDGEQVGGATISISGNANGTGSNIATVQINDTRWTIQTDPSGTPSGPFIFNNNTNISPAFYWVEVNITDAAGNFNSTLRYFEVTSGDVSVPILTITELSPDPSNGFTNITVTSNEALLAIPLLNITLPNSSVIYRTMSLIAPLTWNTNYTVDADLTHTIRINGTDFVSNVGYVTDTFEGDLTDPSITINSPNANDLFGAIAPTYDITLTDVNPGSIWYSLDGGTTNSTAVAATGSISQSWWDALSNGTVTITFYANDTAGNEDTAEVTVRLDIDNPSVSITSPSDNDLNGVLPPTYDVTISDSSGIYNKWYTLDGTNNYTFSGSTGTINSTAWGLEGNGTVTITFYGNDSAGNINSAQVTVRRDIIAPSISVTTPTNNQLTGPSPPTYSLSITEANLDQVWYSLDGGSTNSTPSGSTSGTINAGLWAAVGNGTVTITFYANDTLGNEGTSTRDVLKDIAAPSISVTTPLDNQLTGATPPTYSLSITEANLDQVWYSLDGGSTNSTPSGSTSGTINVGLWAAVGNGTVTITFYANDTLGNEGTSTRDVLKDIAAPSISVTTPTNNQLTGPSPPTYSLSITEANLDQVWYSLDGGSTNSTPSGSTSGTINVGLWAAVGNGTVTITFYANDTLGNEGISTRDVLKDIAAPSISVTTPTNNQLTGPSPPTYSLSITEANLDQVWYSLDGGSTNSTPSGSTSGTINAGLWAAVGNGTVTITFYANDTLGNEGTSTRDVLKDIAAPSISVTTPLDNQLTGATPPTYSLSITEANLGQVWYSLDGGSTNSTPSGSTSGTIDSGLWVAMGNGTVTITFYANDTFGNEGTNTRDVRKDIDKPTLQLTVSPDPSNGPTEIEVINTTEILSSVLANVSTPSAGYIYCILVYQGSNKWNASFTVTESGPYTIYVNGTDLVGNIEYNSTTITGDIGGPNIALDSITPNPSNGLTTITASNSSSDINGNGIRANVTTPSAGIIHINLIYQGANQWTGNFTVTEDGVYAIHINATDTLGDTTHIGPSNINGDISAPTITINGPSGTSGTSPPSFNVTITDISLDMTWYSIYDGSKWSDNKTFTGATGNIDETIWNSMLTTDLIIRFYARDTLGNEAFSDTYVTKESSAADTSGEEGLDSEALARQQEIFATTITYVSIFLGGVIIVASISAIIGRIKKPSAPIPTKKPIKKKSNKNYK